MIYLLQIHQKGTSLKNKEIYTPQCVENVESFVFGRAAQMICGDGVLTRRSKNELLLTSAISRSVHCARADTNATPMQCVGHAHSSTARAAPGDMSGRLADDVHARVGACTTTKSPARCRP